MGGGVIRPGCVRVCLPTLNFVATTQDASSASRVLSVSHTPVRLDQSLPVESSLIQS